MVFEIAHADYDSLAETPVLLLKYGGIAIPKLTLDMFDPFLIM